MNDVVRYKGNQSIYYYHIFISIGMHIYSSSTLTNENNNDIHKKLYINLQHVGRQTVILTSIP